MKIGYQLYSALEMCMDAEGLKTTIQRIGQMGYDGVEFFSYCGIPAAEMKELLAKCGIEAMNSHVQLERWKKDAEGEVAYCAEAGIPYVTIPWMPPELRNDDGYNQIKTLCGRITSICKKYGVRLLYHNHHFEFEPKGDGCVLDDILKEDPETGLELDTFWAYYAGTAPADYMEKMKDRLDMIHVKDYISLEGGPVQGGLEMPLFTAVGTGKMDNRPILEKAKELDLSWVIVEQDNCQIDLMDSAEQSLIALRKSFSA